MLLDLIINITISSVSLCWYFIDIAIFVTIYFWSLSLGLGFLSSAFFFDNDAISKSHFLKNLAPYINLSIYGLGRMITCFISGTHTQKCFVVSALYFIKMFCQTLWQSDFDFFSSEILHKARLPKIWIY